MIPWASPQDRDIFIMSITGAEVKGGTPDTFKYAEVQ